MELVQFFPGNSFTAHSAVSDSVFGHTEGGEPLDLKDGDWAGYDEDAEESVGVYQFTSQFVRNVKK